jgi:hypothetical protein
MGEASGLHGVFQLLECIFLKLTHPFGRDTIGVGQLLQGGLAVIIEPAGADDVLAAFVQ